VPASPLPLRNCHVDWPGRYTFTTRLQQRQLHQLAEQLTASQPGLIAVGEPTIEKALDQALTSADKR
jgi:hypothetical protein